MEPRLAAELAAHEGGDAEFVEAAFQLVLRRSPDEEARDRALAKLAEGTLPSYRWATSTSPAPRRTA